jgi:DNA polymerase-1
MTDKKDPSAALEIAKALTSSTTKATLQWNELTIEDIAKCNGHEVTVDIETNGLQWWRSQIIGIGLYCPSADVIGYLPTLTSEKRQQAKNEMRKWGRGTTFIAHNAKFELHFLDLDPFEQGFTLVDTTDLVHILDSRYKKNLGDCERIFLGTRTKVSFSEMVPKRIKNKIWEWPLDIVAPYCVNDCRVEHLLYEELLPKIRELGLEKLFRKDMKYLAIIWETEHRGIALNVEFVQEAIVAMQEHIEALEEEFYDSVGYKFNRRSPKQLSKALYEDMGIAKPKNPFADADGVDRSKFAGRLYAGPMTSTFLLMEKVKHPLGWLVAQLREADILLNTLKKWLDLRDENNIIHASFNLTGTRTGRLSCREPNLQNIASQFRTRNTQSVFSGDSSIRAKEYNLRHAFTARPGYSFVSVDYSQMEMRMFGIISEDPFLIQSLRSGSDIHADIAEHVWGIRDKVHREWSKTISLGLLYGMTTGSLMHRLNMTASEAKKVTNDYWRRFPRIKPWLDETIEEVKTFGYAQYWSGRRWYEDDPGMFYVGVNAKIQGGSADVLSIAAIRVSKWLRSNIPSGKSSIVNFIHDELMAEVPDEYVDATAKAMADIMAVPDLFGMSWKVSVKVGKSYGTLDDWGEKAEF